MWSQTNKKKKSAVLLISHEAKSLFCGNFFLSFFFSFASGMIKDTDKIIIITTPQLMLCHGFTEGTKSEWPLSCCPCLLLSPGS